MVLYTSDQNFKLHNSHADLVRFISPSSRYFLSSTTAIRIRLIHRTAKLSKAKPKVITYQQPYIKFDSEIFYTMDSFQIFTTSTSLVDSVDKKLLVVLRDGRKLIGILRSFDQFANLVLEDTIERIYVADTYGDIPRGIFIIRGENVVLLGEIDEDKEDESPLREVPVENVLQIQREEMEAKVKREKTKHRMLSDQGFSVDVAEFGELY
ncbi:SM-like, degradation of cytoplasmic mRNAs and positively regulates transcription initiation [Linnemannia zychae]|nr:SM-like, degradation of cytoplasmic mRNAs and positively regulates transcription initiation [Linnemannia zychae]